MALYLHGNYCVAKITATMDPTLPSELEGGLFLTETDGFPTRIAYKIYREDPDLDFDDEGKIVGEVYLEHVTTHIGERPVRYWSAGIYVDESMRRRGIAARAILGLCNHLLLPASRFSKTAAALGLRGDSTIYIDSDASDGFWQRSGWTEREDTEADPPGPEASIQLGEWCAWAHDKVEEYEGRERRVSGRHDGSVVSRVPKSHPRGQPVAGKTPRRKTSRRYPSRGGGRTKRKQVATLKARLKRQNRKCRMTKRVGKRQSKRK